MSSKEYFALRSSDQRNRIDRQKPFSRYVSASLSLNESHCMLLHIRKDTVSPLFNTVSISNCNEKIILQFIQVKNFIFCTCCLRNRRRSSKNALGDAIISASPYQADATLKNKKSWIKIHQYCVILFPLILIATTVLSLHWKMKIENTALYFYPTK